MELSKEGELYQVYKAVCVEAAQQLARTVIGRASTEISSSSMELASSSSQIQVTSPPEVKSQDPIPLPKPLAIHSKMSVKKKIALALGIAAIGDAGGGSYFNYGAAVSALDYDDAIQAGDYYAAETAFSDIEEKKKMRMVFYTASIATAFIGAVLWFWPE